MYQTGISPRVFGHWSVITSVYYGLYNLGSSEYSLEVIGES